MLIALALSVFVALLGAIGVVAPEALLGIARRFQSPSGIYLAAALRIALGASLLVAARRSRAPRAVRVIGIVILVGGLLTPVIGLERFREIVEWWGTRGPLLMRGWSALALVAGATLAYLVAPAPPPR